MTEWGDLRSTEPRASPFLKWAGGKTQVLPYLRPHYPEFARRQTFFEPFLGGGAVFFDLSPPRAILSDRNSDLILTFDCVKNHLKELIDTLVDLPSQPTHTDYYRLRSRYNQLIKVTGRSELAKRLEKSALLIWLNHTCFNGLYRVNQKGEFNVPFGSYKSFRIFSKANLLTASRALRGAKARLSCNDFEKVLEQARSGDFVYLDPPYQPLSRTAHFTSYTANGFGWKEQERLALVVRGLATRGVKVLLSDSSTPEISRLYSDFEQRLALVPRAINRIGSKRGKVEELLVVA